MVTDNRTSGYRLTIEIQRIKAVAGYSSEVRDRLPHLTHCPVILGTSLCSRPSHSGLLPLKTQRHSAGRRAATLEIPVDVNVRGSKVQDPDQFLHFTDQETETSLAT